MRILTFCLALLLAACSPSPEERAAFFRAEGDRLDAAARNVQKAFTYEDFIASPQYRQTRDMWRGGALSQYNPKNSRVEILLKEQRGRLYINDTIAMDFPICSGRIGGMETPKGTFRISQKKEMHRSNRYGVFMSKADGSVVKWGVTADDAVPAGMYFEGTDMPYWLRFNGGIGLHVGKVERNTDSHGCVRVPEEAAVILFEKLEVGSKVVVK